MKANVLGLTNREMRVLRDEINRQTAHNVRKLAKNFQAMVLWELREQEGWGKVKLLRFQERFIPAIRELEKFYMSANAGEALKPMSKVASGGELARIMLAIKNVLAEQDQVNTLIFDELLPASDSITRIDCVSLRVKPVLSAGLYSILSPVVP